MSNQNREEWTELIERLADVKTAQHKKDFFEDLLRGTLTGEYQWNDKSGSTYYIYHWPFSAWCDPDNLTRLQTVPHESRARPLMEWEISKTDGELLLQAIEMQMVKREEERIKSLIKAPVNGSLFKTCARNLLKFARGCCSVR